MSKQDLLQKIENKLSYMHGQIENLQTFDNKYDELAEKLKRLEAEQQKMFDFDRDVIIRDLHHTLTNASESRYKLAEEVEGIKESTFSTVESLYTGLCQSAINEDDELSNKKKDLKHKIKEVITLTKEVERSEDLIIDEMSQKVTMLGYPTFNAIHRFAPRTDDQLLEGVGILEEYLKK